MASIQDALRERAKALLADGSVASFIGWEAGRFENQTTPLICLRASDADRLVFNKHCVNTLGKYARDLAARGKVGIAVRGCDARAVNRMTQDNQIKREDVYLVGIGCPGMLDSDGNALDKCASCAHPNPPVFDEMIGEPVAEAAPEGRFADVSAMEFKSREERQAFFDDMFSKCIRCYACRSVCPCCTCRTCFTEDRRTAWQGRETALAENRFYLLTRAFHISDRCIDCGECERACPMDLPLMLIHHKLMRDMEDLFGPYESGMTADNPDALVRYRTDDVEEFM